MHPGLLFRFLTSLLGLAHHVATISTLTVEITFGLLLDSLVNEFLLLEHRLNFSFNLTFIKVEQIIKHFLHIMFTKEAFEVFQIDCDYLGGR